MARSGLKAKATGAARHSVLVQRKVLFFSRRRMKFRCIGNKASWMLGIHLDLDRSSWTFHGQGVAQCLPDSALPDPRAFKDTG